MINYKIVNATDKDKEMLTSIKLVTMIDDEMDKVLSSSEKQKIRKSVLKNIELTGDSYKIIYIDNKIAGAYVTIPYELGTIIDEIYLFDEYRNKKIGTSIIEKIKKENQELYIWVYKNNKKALNLFLRLGFIPISNGRTMILKFDKIFNAIKEKINNIKLGYRDKDGNLYSNFKWNFKDIFYFQSPKQLLESQIGTCFEQVELERDLISKLGCEVRTYFIYYPSDTYELSHAFLIYKDSKKYYWLENAWQKYKGLHTYNTKEDLFNDVLNKFVTTIPKGDFKKVKMYLYEKPRFGINYLKFFAHCINGRNMKIK